MVQRWQCHIDGIGHLKGPPCHHLDKRLALDRLKKLVDRGLLSTSADPAHKQKTVYSLTEPAIQLVPLIAQMGAWGRRFTPATRELSIRAQLLEEGGPEMWEAFMAELRSLHLGAQPPQRSVIGELTEAYLAAVADRVTGRL